MIKEIIKEKKYGGIDLPIIFTFLTFSSLVGLILTVNLFRKISIYNRPRFSIFGFSFGSSIFWGIIFLFWGIFITIGYLSDKQYTESTVTYILFILPILFSGALLIYYKFYYNRYLALIDKTLLSIPENGRLLPADISSKDFAMINHILNDLQANSLLWFVPMENNKGFKIQKLSDELKSFLPLSVEDIETDTAPDNWICPSCGATNTNSKHLSRPICEYCRTPYNEK